MLKQVTVSAPGKLMLFGEHAVVYGRPCIVTAVNQRLKLKASKLKEPVLKLEAPDVDVKNYSKPLSHLGKGNILRGAKFVEIAVLNFFKKHKDVIPANAGIQLITDSQFKSTFGFGSSSASAVCTIKALSELFKIKLTNEQIFDICYKTVLDVQGVGSGFDLAAAIYGGTLYFVTGGKTIQPLTISHLPLIVGYTGIKADTPTLVRQVNALKESYPVIVDNIFDHMDNIVMQAKEALLKNDLQTLGELMNFNQGYLDSLGVNSKILSNLIYAAKDAGAYGAKLSGAGGGDCMIALAPPSKRKAVEKAIEKAGGQVLKVEVNAKGVKLER